MLEEVQMPPRLVLRVVNRTTLASALSAGEPAPAWKIHVQIEPTILDRKLATRHHPRRLQPKGQLEKIGVSHPLRLNAIPPQRSPTRPQIPTYPLLSARSRGKCLHYYFDFIDDEVGLCYLRVPTWCPFRLQFYCNGHGWLARQLAAAGIGFTLADNAFLRIDDWERAQTFADALAPKQLHRVLDRFAQLCCPVMDTFDQRYHWSLTQVEYAIDLVFRSAATLKPLYEQLSRQAVLSVKAEHVASFLGKKITPQLAQEVGSRFETRIEGTCIKHRLGKAQVKMYDKFHLVLRIETTANDVSFFKHHRRVEHRQGPSSRELATLKKTIYSLIDLPDILLGCCRRYLVYLSALDDHSAGVRALDRLSEDRRDEDRLIKGLNFFKRSEQAWLRALQRPQFNIRGLRRADLTAFVPGLSPAALSRQITRMRRLDLIKRVAGLSLLPDPPRPRRDRRSFLHNRDAHHPNSRSRTLTQSSPFQSRLNS